jgi:hypothetical protein
MSFLNCSYILKVGFDKEGLNGILYVWIGSKAVEEEARLAEEIATTYFSPVGIIHFNSIQV